MKLKQLIAIALFFFFDSFLFASQSARSVIGPVLQVYKPLTIITVDGLSGCGKSTVCKKLAQERELPYLYTGFLYRGLALALSNNGYNEQTFSDMPNSVVEAYMKDISYTYNQKTGPCVFYKGLDVTAFLKNKKIDLLAPLLANKKEVRFAILDREHAFVRNGGGAVVDSRDAGWFAFSPEFFPNDTVYRFFLTAHILERAERWKKDQEKRDTFYTIGQAYDHINKRDTLEKSLAWFRVDKAPDAIEIDTTVLRPDIVFDQVVRRIAKN